MNHTFIKTNRRLNETMFSAVAPLVVLPPIAYTLYLHTPAWQLMWSLAISIYFGFKWLTFASGDLTQNTSPARVLAYLLLWPGMNAKSFLTSKPFIASPTNNEWLLAIAKLGFGVLLLFVVVPTLVEQYPLVAGWIGMIGLVFIFHFGGFHILSLCWRINGIDAEPIMNYPILASSLGDFWGRRWNMAFRDLAFGHILRPLVGQIGVVRATMIVFLISGLIHELVISVPARGGWGGPTFYFIVQGMGLLMERSRRGRMFGLGSGIIGRLFCGLIVVVPVELLFHQAFVRQVILPTLAAIGAF